MFYSNLQTVVGLTSPISMTDGTNDVVRITIGTYEYKGGYTLDDIDISLLTVTADQHVNLTILGDLSKWNWDNYTARIYFTNEPYILLSEPSYPYYYLKCCNESGEIKASLYMQISSYLYSIWNGSDWVSVSDYRVGGTFNSHMISADFPEEAYEIPDGIYVTAVIWYYGNYYYTFIDSVPIIFSITNSDEIPGFDLLLLSGFIIGITTLIIFNRRNNWRKS